MSLASSIELPGLSRRQLNALVIFVLSVSLLRGIAFPHAWAATHHLFTYDEGFVKRALLGAVLDASGVPWLRSYAFVFVFGLVLLAGELALIVAAFVELHRSRSTATVLVPLVYASSLAVPYLGNSLGYFDHLGLLAALTALTIRGFWKRLAFAAVAFGLLIFVHEAVFVIFLPVVLASLAMEAGRDVARWSAMLAIGSILAAATYLAGTAIVTSAASTRMYEAAAASADFAVDRGAFAVLARSGADNLHIMWRAFGQAKHYERLLFSFAATLPTTLVLAWVAFRSCARRRAGILMVAAALSPWAMHLWGWDIHRWNTLAITTSFLAVVTALRFGGRREEPARSPDARRRAAVRYALACACIVTLNMTSSIPFLDGRRMVLFPFERHVDYWTRIDTAGFPEPPSAPLKLEKILPLEAAARPSSRRGLAPISRRTGGKARPKATKTD